MYLILGPHGMIRWSAIVGLVIFLLTYILSPPADLVHAARYVSGTVTAVVVLAVLFGSSWGLWRYIWKIQWVNRVVYPDLNGTWEGYVSSNWPVIEEMARAARNEGASYDVLSVDDTEKFTAASTRTVMRIRASWFNISMRIETTGRYSSSQTIFVVPQRSVNGRPHRLHYMYENETPTPRRIDTNRHFGAASLDVFFDEPLTLAGTYWTNRNWTKGMNTAGRISVRRVSSNPDADIEELPA